MWAVFYFMGKRRKRLGTRRAVVERTGPHINWTTMDDMMDCALGLPLVIGGMIALGVGAVVIVGGIWGAFWLLHAVVGLIGWLWHVTG